MNRRGFLGWLGVGAAGATVAAVAPLVLTHEQVEAAPPAKLSDIKPGSRHFAVLMNYRGEPVRAMLVDDLPQEIHIQHENHDLVCVFRLVSKDRYDGRTVEGLARYIAYKGPVPAGWGRVKLGF